MSVTTAVELLLFTGYRLSEVLNLRWEQVDFEGSQPPLPNATPFTEYGQNGGIIPTGRADHS